ncbi:MAG: 2-polyprenyl-6-hydroxyphenyl methylase/3-demethylubiquinone-9 3-methyltransferase [Lentisphaeria bacterium]|jgi:2-polyprenyl-6-hydroxyphenyl methylase/3-demethylubiquinone-9 3-methyltransferase
MNSSQHKPSVNVDPSEIAKFERMASQWWDLDGEFKPLHDMNPLRCNYVDARSAVVEKTLVDVGCGGGILCEAMSLRGADVTGIDMGDAPLEVAKLHGLESGVSVAYYKATAEAFAAKHREQFEIVTCFEMLEHVPDPGAVIKACANLAQPGGDLFFSTINRNAKAYALAILGAEYIARLLPKGTHEYKKFIRPSELSAWIRNANLELVDVSGITYNPLTKKFRLNPNDVDVNYLIHAKKVV